MNDPFKIAQILAELQTEELTEVYEHWNNISLNKRIEPLILMFRDLELDTKETKTLCDKLTNITWCSNQRNNNKEELNDRT